MKHLDHCGYMANTLNFNQYSFIAKKHFESDWYEMEYTKYIII